MESYESILAVGGKTNSLGRADEVISSVYADPSRLDELFNCISANDAWVRMRAVDAFEKIAREHPEWIQPYLDKIFSDLALSSQPSIQWHLAQIFSEVQLTDEQRENAIAWLKDKIKTIEVDWIVSVNTMKALVYFYGNGLLTTEDLIPLFKLQQQHKSNTVKKKAAQFLQQL
jgi:hypothetical protein